MTVAGRKRCRVCKIEKSLEDFHRVGDGLDARCRECSNAYHSTYNVDNRDRLRQAKLDACGCGALKDRRSSRCRACYFAEKASSPCRGCGRCLSEAEFGIRPDGHGGHKRRAQCKECERVAQKARMHGPRREELLAHRRARSVHDPLVARRYYLNATARKYGVPVERLLVDRCEICSWTKASPSDRSDRLYFDHCHKTGRFRGVLCGRCNFMLGHASDDPERLRAAASYLDRFVDD